MTMLMMLDEKLKAQGKEGLDPRLFRQKAISFVGIGGSNWAVRVETDHAMLAMSPGWKIVNNEFFCWCKDVIMQDDKIERMKEIGRNLVDAAQYIIDNNIMIPGSDDVDLWKGADSACPHCHSNNFYIFPGTNHAVCELCDLEGHLEVIDGAMKLVNDESIVPNGQIWHCHDLLSGKKAHGEDVFENESRLINLHKDETFKARKAHYMDAGQLVPDAIIIDIIHERLEEADCANGFILDGVPRTVEQAEELENVGILFDAVISLEVPDEVILDRISGRRVCDDCGASYHVTNVPPKHSGVCDRCGGKLVQRDDDAPETVKQRLTIYYEKTAPLKDYYAGHGILKPVEMCSTVEHNTEVILNALTSVSTK